jgi:hypothetical protein
VVEPYETTGERQQRHHLAEAEFSQLVGEEIQAGRLSREIGEWAVFNYCTWTSETRFQVPAEPEGS